MAMDPKKGLKAKTDLMTVSIYDSGSKSPALKRKTLKT